MRIIVVGAGVVGLGSAFELSRAGHAVTVVTATVAGSQQSAGLSRIFRLAHADGPLTDAAARSLELWREWESLMGETLLEPCGLLLTGDVSEREPHLGRYGGLQELKGAAHPLAVAHDRWWLERTGAAIRAEATIRLLQTDVDVILAEVIAADAGGVRLEDGARLDADAVVICAGPDTYRLMGLPTPERLRSVRFSFALRDPLESPAPCWIQRDERLAPPFYALMDGPDHYSVGLSDGAPVEVSEPVHIREAHRKTVDIAVRVFPGLIPVAERVIACEYPLNSQGPLAHDGWDLREHEGLLGVTGPSLFKFAPLLGSLVAERIAERA